MFTNGKITLYSLKDGKYLRSVHDAFYVEVSSAQMEKAGLVQSHSVSVHIPYRDEIISFTTQKDFVVNGECDIELDNSTQQSLSEGLTLLKARGMVTIMTADSRLYGCDDMWHYKLLCK